MKRLKTILQSRYIFKILTILILIITIIYTKYYPFKSVFNTNDTEFIGIVEDYIIKDNQIKISLKSKERIIVTYKYTGKVFNNLSYGDKIKVTGVLKEPSTNNIFNNFNYKKYLYNKKIYYIIEASKIDKIQNNNNHIYTIKNLLYTRINSLKSSNYIKALLFGDNKLDKEIKTSYQINGISHLFSVSGFHINFITSIIYFYLDRVTYNKKIKYITVDIFLVLYLLLCNTTSLLRCTVMNILLSINHLLKINIKKIDIVLLTLILCIIINPFIIYDIGFIYSYTISFFLILYKNKYKTNNKLLKIIYISLISFLVSLPINIYTSYEINFLSIILNIIIVPIVSLILLPLSLLTLIFPILDNILYLITSILEKISLYTSNINIFKQILSKPSIILIIIYYLVIILILSKNKHYYLILILLIFHKTIPLYNSNLEVVMFDVGEADSMLISTPSKKVNILIDTGRGIDINNIIIYLKSIGISKLNYLIITHGDEDHIGGALYLIDNFKVDNVILNKGDYTELEVELITHLKNKNIKYTNNINKIPLLGSYMYLLNTKKFSNENDNSIVTYFEYQKYKFLFMGDSSSKTEEYLINNYNLANISFLKVGHHGSNTSSSPLFINKITPKVSLISVGRNNFYHHPNKEVLTNLSNSVIYRTDINKSIKIKINNKVKITKLNNN
ncbi:dNA internalization-related competence protein ComEC/Rec2 [Clostridium sp. CAG:302]|nr:dNA internalization-related competence protein ComEC/Rec2 [Clostridium sp. CAG:302]